MRGIEARIVRLEDRQPKGCATCREWQPEPLAVVFQDAIGRRHGDGPNRPDVCPECRRTLPQPHTIVLTVRPDGPQ